MKVYIGHPEATEDEEFLLVNEIPVNPDNLEGTRKILQEKMNSKFVWFEHEEPPDEIINALVQGFAKASLEPLLEETEEEDEA